MQQQLIFLSLNKSSSSSQYSLLNKVVLTNENEKKQTYEAILLLRDFADKINARIFFFVVPNKQLTLQNQCCESDTLAAGFYNFTKAHNLNLIDIPKAFSNYPDQSNLFFERDFHFTVEGNLVAAEAISNKLRLSEEQ